MGQRSIVVLLIAVGALAGGWWIGANTTERPPASGAIVESGLAGTTETPLPMLASADITDKSESHDIEGSSNIAEYCTSVWGGQRDRVTVCQHAEEAARFELIAMCGTEEMMDMWRSCAATSGSHAVQRHCLKRRLNTFDERHQRLSERGLKLVATAEMAEGHELKVWSKDARANRELSESVVAVAAGETIVHVGASTAPVEETLTRWRQTINTGLAGRRALSTSYNLQSWTDLLMEHGVLEIYARKGETVVTQAGRFNAYRAEAQHLASDMESIIANLLE